MRKEQLSTFFSKAAGILRDVVYPWIVSIISSAFRFMVEVIYPGVLSFLSNLFRLLVKFLDTTGRYSRICFDVTSAWAKKNWPPVRDRLRLYVQLTRLNKPVGAFLLLWPTLWALWIASNGLPGLHLFLVFTLGVFLTRSAGCVFNDMADKDLDSYVRRTYMRPLAAGAITQTEALLVACVLLLIAFLLVLTTNHLTVILSFVAVPLAIVYPFMKRYTYVPQFFLGLAFSWGIPMAFAAVTNTIPTIAWLLFIANILWAVIYDTMYAMVDREDDLKIGIKSTAILFDDADRIIIGVMQTMFLVVLITIGIQIKAEMIYYYSLIAATGFMLFHQYLIKDRTPEQCFRAFLNNNWLGMAIFIGIYINYI